jgi:hypothetical protein
MASPVVCPKCNFEFELTDALEQSITENLRKKYNQKWMEQTKEREDNFKQREAEMQRQLEQQAQSMRQREELLLQQQNNLAQEKLRQEQELNRRIEEQRKAIEAQLSQQMQQQFANEFGQQIKLLEEANKANEGKLSAARDKELEFLKRMQELQTKEQEIELQIQRQVLEERSKLSEQIKKEEEERNKLRDTEFHLKIRERDKQLEDQQKLIAEMKRKMEQGSMQLQGEIQELELEQMLRQAFPFDKVNEVGKGVRGADCVLTVRNGYGQECGTIVFESKRTKEFSEEWVEKLKNDSRSRNADLAVIVTQAMPKGMEGFGERNGVWICDFNDVRPLTVVLRDLIIKVHSAAKSQENKGDKMTLLYTYLVSREFAEQWAAIREGFMSMKMSIVKERDQMEKLWKAREKQLEKVLLNAAHIRGSIEGIAGMDVDLELSGESTFQQLGSGLPE